MTKYPFSASTLHEAQGRNGALPCAIQPLARGMVLGGPAFTVETAPGENLMVHAAIIRAPPGSVLVVATGYQNGFEYTYWGDIMTTAAQVKGLAGLVIDGCVRDVDEIVASGFPVFCRGPSMLGPGKGSVGSIGEPVRIGAITVQTGDLVVADSDGVVVVPAASKETVLAAAQKRAAAEDAAIVRLRGGETVFDIHGWKQP